MQLGQLVLGSLYLLLAAASASDAASRRVPNVLTVAVAVLGLCAHFMAGGARAVLPAAGAALLLLAILLVPFSRRMLGGGDVKLMAACAAWTSFQRLPVFLLAAALAGGLVALAAVASALRVPAVATNTAASPSVGPAATGPRVRLRAVRVPFAIAITVGAVIALHWRMP